jgi:hypothetical protein
MGYQDDEEQEENKAVKSFRGSMDLFMGVVYIMISAFCIKNPNYLKQFGGFPNDIIYVIASMFLCYGMFRCYRGLQTIRSLLHK